MHFVINSGIFLLYGSHGHSRVFSFRKNRDIRFHENCSDTHENQITKSIWNQAKLITQNTHIDFVFIRGVLDDWRMGNFPNRKLLFHEIASKIILIGKPDTPRRFPFHFDGVLWRQIFQLK